jgi:hypothetical protein
MVIDLRQFYQEKALLSDLPKYAEQVLGMIKGGEEVTLTGQAPVWLYLKVAHALHGKVRKLVYNSPVTGDVVIFDHTPF